MTRWLPVLALLLAGCKNEQNFAKNVFRNVAVTLGDFDDVSAPLDRRDVATTPYNGFIGRPVWDDQLDANSGIAVESLFQAANPGEDPPLFDHDLIIFASGTRGMGARAYDDITPDDGLVSDREVIAHIREFVRRGGTIVCTDWTYDLIEAAYPAEVEWVRESVGYDGAQTGEPGVYTAAVKTNELQSALDAKSIAIDFNYSNWAVPKEVRAGGKVWLEAKVDYALPDQGGIATAIRPLIIEMEPVKGSSGRMIYFAFHLSAQRAEAVDAMLDTIVGQITNEGGS